MESLCLKFTNEPSIFVDGDLVESIKRSASDRLGDLVPYGSSPDFSRVFHNMALLGLCLELSFNELECTNLVHWTAALDRFSSRHAVIVVGSVSEKHFDGDFTQD